jgi:hypothetical protein
MANDVYKPKVAAAGLDRKKRNGQFINPPSYGEIGGMTGASKLERGDKNLMNIQRGGPKAKRGPI